jgi:hypothetical protein
VPSGRRSIPNIRLRHAKDKAEFDQFMAERFMAERRNFGLEFDRLFRLWP